MESMAAEKPSSILTADALGATFRSQSELFERFISMARSLGEERFSKQHFRIP